MNLENLRFGKGGLPPPESNAIQYQRGQAHLPHL